MSVASGILYNTGHLLENLIFISLRRVSSEVYYYRTKSGLEVDFIVQMQNRSWSLIQVCESLVQPKTRKREVTALNEAMIEQGMAFGTIVTRAEEDEINVHAGNISIVPAWRFILHLSESGD